MDHHLENLEEIIDDLMVMVCRYFLLTETFPSVGKEDNKTQGNLSFQNSQDPGGSFPRLQKQQQLLKKKKNVPST